MVEFIKYVEKKSKGPLNMFVLVCIAILLAMSLSYLLTWGILAIIAWALGYTMTAKMALGIWLALFLIGAFFKK